MNRLRIFRFFILSIIYLKKLYQCCFSSYWYRVLKVTQCGDDNDDDDDDDIHCWHLKIKVACFRPFA